MARTNQLSLLMLGASYGLVFGLKAAHAGHRVTFVCKPNEQELINQGKAAIKLSSKLDGTRVTLSSNDAPVPPVGISTQSVNPQDYDLCVLAMQEPQYADHEIQRVVQEIIAAQIPILSIMNMPLPPFLKSNLGLETHDIASVWKNYALWDSIDPERFTASSPDPQATTRIEDDTIIVDVNHPTNFKVGPFAKDKDQALLSVLAESQRVGGIPALQTGAKIVADKSRLVAIAKWPMLITGNFRSWSDGNIVSIKQAVHSDIRQSAEIYDWVCGVCHELAKQTDLGPVPLVPFERYALAAETLTLPSSLARGLSAGAIAVERVDRLIQALAAKSNTSHPILDDIVYAVDNQLRINQESH